MDSTNMARPSLPPIHSLDMDKYHREEVDYQRRHADAPLPAPLSTVAAPGPYPSGPPPPYSAASNAQTTTAVCGPPSDRRIYPTDDREPIHQQPKQSLPSLHEALGVEQQHAATSTSESTRPPLTLEAPRPTAYAHASVPVPVPAPPHHTPYSRSHRGSISYERRSSDNDMTPYARHYPSQHSPIITPSQREARPYSPSERHRPYDRPPQPAAPSSSFSFGYAPYPGRFPSSTGAVPPPSSQPSSHPQTSSAASIYQPSVSHPPPSARPTWHSDMAPSHTRAHTVPESATAVYGESVKRHLDMYDFELALNEILDHSTVMCDFSRAYGARLHQNARSGPAPGTLPAITEVEELMNKSRFTLEALGRMREVLIAQEAAYLQQAQEQRFQSEAEAEAEAKRNDSVHVSEEGKGGFAGSEPKKRRGRAAAPGRCHSCNRAETPEWRRGPDGARTLCNACGLHYAKLTRKAGANKAAVGSSNLRPKSPERDVAPPQ